MAKIKANAYGSDLGDEEAILDPAVYSDAFEKIAQGVFLRQTMAAKAVKATQVAAEAPAVAAEPAAVAPAVQQ